VPGLVAGKYEVLDLIGRGGMGSVWEGRHSSLGTRVAIKFVDPEHAQSQEARSRFVTEARAAATIQSKHAIQIYDHGVTDDGRPYIVMEMLVGEPLDKRLERLHRLSLQETARILGQVCRALQRAHDAGIIHRDLKPENIFLVRSPDDDEEIAKVLDFGIAKIMAAPGAQPATSSTKTGAVLGTPYYMSPEQARGLRNIDHRTDLWSLGVIAYKCVVGALPFEGQSVGDLLVNICTGPVPTPSFAAPVLPRSFDAWFFRAMQRDPEQRFSQALELSDALAVAAGLSARRGAMSSQDAGLGVPDTQLSRGGPASRTTAGARENGLPAAITSAALAASAPPARASRGALLGVAFVAIVVGGIGVTAVVKVARGPKQVSDDLATGVAPGALSAAAPASTSASGAALALVAGAAASATETAAAGAAASGAAAARAHTPAATITAGAPTTPPSAARSPGAKAPARPLPGPASGAPSANPAAPKQSSPGAADPGY
jgi:serine/threonine-protein kinase